MSATDLQSGAAARAQAARLLASWWSRPTARETERWDASWESAIAVADSLLEPSSRVFDLEAALDEASATELLEEYERLLVGPGRVSCAPYESLWRTDAPRREHGVLMGAAAADVAVIYRDLGLQVRSDAHELPDHVAIEWEALAHAFENDADASASALLGDHLAQWIPSFAAAVAAETNRLFYATLARVTAEWTAALAA